MKKMNFKKALPFITAILVFIIVSLVYFSPVLSGKQIQQSDIVQFSGMAKEVVDFRKENNNTEPYWLGNAFSGMPAYQVSAYYPNDFIRYIDNLLRFLPRPADYLFLYFLGFFLLLNALKVEWKLAILGALSFGFSTYLIIIFGAGHNNKAHAIAYMPLVIAGVLYVFQKRYLLGFVVTALAMALELHTNHPQMTYYLGFCLLILGIVEFVEAFKTKTLPIFAKQAGVLIVAMLIGIGTNATKLLPTKEYTDFSTRGKSELTINPDGTPKQKSSGLDKAYITEYSYGKLETFNLLVPRFMGGGTVEKLGESSNFYQTLEKNAGKKVAKDYAEQVLTYWGTQPIVEAPAYIGAIIFFLFFLGIFLLEDNFKVTGVFILCNIIMLFIPSEIILGKILFILLFVFLIFYFKNKVVKWLFASVIFFILLSLGKNLPFLTNFFIDYVPLFFVLLFVFLIFYFKNKIVKWLFASVIFSILLSWGKNLPFLTDFFIDYVPLYNKFRAVSSIQVIAELCVPLLGVLGLKEFFSSQVSSEEKIKSIKKATILVVGLVLVGLVLAYASSTFEGIRDGQYQQLPALIDALIADRKAMLLSDSLRSVVLILLSAGLLWAFLQKKLKKVPVLVALAVLILFDLVSVDIKYVNKDNFTSARKVKKPFEPTEADKQILEDKSHYRVANFTGNFMNEGRTSYFHKSIGGYHAAKMKRYQELFDYQFNNKKQNPQILNMLNTKYLIVGADQVQVNPDANGNAWFVDNIVEVYSADEEMQLLDSIDTKKTAIMWQVSKGKRNQIISPQKDTTATIKLVKYDANKLVYESNAQKPQIAVFSEIYYPYGWNAYIDGVRTHHFRVNYVLRGMEVPQGKHTIEFKFEPQVIKIGGTISLVSYALLLLIPVGWFFFEKKKK